MVHSQTIETYGPQPNNRNIWSSRLADSFVCFSTVSLPTTIQTYNEAFRASCLATFFMLSSDLDHAWHALIFARVTLALRSESCWHHDSLRLPVSVWLHVCYTKW